MGAAIKKIISEIKDKAATADDLIVQSGDLEVVLVLCRSGKRHLQHIKRAVREVVGKALAKEAIFETEQAEASGACDKAGILPMLGTAVYPTDSADADELVEIASQRADKLLGSQVRFCVFWKKRLWLNGK